MACTGGSLLGLALDSAGLVYACDAGARAVVAIDPDTGRTAAVSEGAQGRPLVEPNGIALGPDGVLCATRAGWPWPRRPASPSRIASWTPLVVTSYGARQLVEVPALVAGSAVPRPPRPRPERL